MCGRYSGIVDPMELADILSIDLCTYEFTPRPMIAPTQTASVIVRENNRTELRPMRWGLIPHWADDEKIGSKLINARSETAVQKPAFRDAWRKRRCLVPADGFYEWNHRHDGTGKKQPYLFRLPNQKIFCFAGLWERWHRPEPEQPELFADTFEPPPPVLETFTILTTRPNAVVEKYHDRMPVMINANCGDCWLESDSMDLGSFPSPLEVLKYQAS